MSQTASNETVVKKTSLQAGAVTVLVCGAIVITLGMGVRQSFGIFLKPVTVDLEIGRQVFGLAIALQTLLTGLLGPAAGMLSDRFGPNRVIAAGTLIYGLGLMLAGFAQGPNSLVLTLGGVVGLGMSLLTLPVVRSGGWSRRPSAGLPSGWSRRGGRSGSSRWCRAHRRWSLPSTGRPRSCCCRSRWR
jgi:MFS family permease